MLRLTLSDFKARKPTKLLSNIQGAVLMVPYNAMGALFEVYNKRNSSRFWLQPAWIGDIRDLKIGVYGKRLTLATYFVMEIKLSTVKCFTYTYYQND